MNSFGVSFSSEVNSETVQRKCDRVRHLVVPPYADLHELFRQVGDQVDLNLFVDVDVRNLDGVVE